MKRRVTRESLRTVRVLGVDPGTAVTGWGVVEATGARIRGIEAGTIRAPRSREFGARLKLVHDGVTEVIARFAPDVVAVESVFFGRHASAALQLGHVRGVVLLACETAGLPVHGLAPALVKKAIAGRGAAEKSQVARIVAALLGWKSLPALDATDALATAITCAQASSMIPQQ